MMGNALVCGVIEKIGYQISNIIDSEWYTNEKWKNLLVENK
jgi:hypothetical protein